MNQKGLTMIELLAAITILGILTGVAIVAVSWILDLNEERYYSTLEKNVILAAQSYYADHRAALPQAIGQSREITLKTLVERKYLPEVLDYRKGDCTKASGSYVKVTKYSKKDYLYAAYFECPDYETKEEDKIKDISISISFTFDEKKIEDAVSNIKISSTEENKIASYEYGIYKDGQNVYNSDNIPAGYVDSTSRKIKLEKYVPGNIRVVVTAYDIYGNRKTEEKEASIYNNFVPECGSFSPKYTDWTNSFNAKRKVTIQCVDTEIECLRRKFSETFTTDMKTGYISILGKNNKEKKCPVGVYIDKTDPECGTNTGSTNWTTSDRTVKVDCIDGTSGCKKDYYEKTYTTSTITSNIEIGDKAGNTKSCPVDVYVDKTPPRCGIVTGAGTSWTNQNRTITVQCVDGESGCKQESYTKVVTENTKTTTITIEDNVGHKTNCEVNAYVDKTPPTCGTITGESTQWSRGPRLISAECKDSGGSGCQVNPFSQSFTTEGTTDVITISDNAGNTNSCTVNKYIDLAPPECPRISASFAARTWTNLDISFQFAFAPDTAKYVWLTRTKSATSGWLDWEDWGENPVSVTEKTISGEGNRKVAVDVYDSLGNKRRCVHDYVYKIDKTPPYTPYMDAQLSSPVSGTLVYVNQYGTLPISIDLQKAGDLCYTSLSCDVGPTSTTKGKCAYKKKHDCGSRVLSVSDNTSGGVNVSGIHSIIETSQTDYHCVKANGQGDQTVHTYVAKDNAGNVSKELRIDILNCHIFTCKVLNEYYEKENYKWKFKKDKSRPATCNAACGTC